MEAGTHIRMIDIPHFLWMFVPPIIGSRDNKFDMDFDISDRALSMVISI